MWTRLTKFPSHAFSSVAMASSNTFKLGLCQLMVGTNKEKNLENASKAIEDVVNKGADIIVLPEIFNSPYSNDSFPVYCEPVPDCNTPYSQISQSLNPSTFMLSNAAKNHQKYIIGGSIPEQSLNDSNEKVLYNTCLVFNESGDIIAKHRKIHLFDINVPGKMTFYESKTLTAGNSFTMFEINSLTNIPLKIGIGICYDIRFAELAEIYRSNGCNLIVYPGAFNTTTGPMHWELLQRARATDNQLFVTTCSPARDLNSSYHAYGHSSVINPWGKVIGTMDEKPNNIVVDIDLNIVKEVRDSIPISKQKRYDLYQPITSKL